MARQKRPNTRRKHQPQRTCVVCRRTAAKRSLTRLVRTPDAGVLLDRSGKLAGRGAYLCDDPICWTRAIQTDVLASALRTTLSADDRARLAAAAPSTDTNSTDAKDTAS